MYIFLWKKFLKFIYTKNKNQGWYVESKQRSALTEQKKITSFSQRNIKYNIVLGRNKCMCGSSHLLCYGCMQSFVIHNSFGYMVGSSFVLVRLRRLNISEPEPLVTWSHRTDHKPGVHFPFLMGKRIQSFGVSAWSGHLNSFLTCGINYIWKIRNFCLLLKHFLRELKGFCLVQSVLGWEIWNLHKSDG